MRITFKIGAFVAVAWMLVKMIFHVLGFTEYIQPMVFINMFFLLVAVAVGLYLHKKQEGFTQGNALSDIKASMQAGIPYAALVSLFIYFYYNNINPDFVKHRVAEAEMTIQNALNDPKQFEQIRAEQEAFEVMTKEAIQAELVKGPRSFYSAGATAIIGLLGLTLLATLYSIFVTVIFRKVVLRELKTIEKGNK
jgi:hypothetical protein